MHKTTPQILANVFERSKKQSSNDEPKLRRRNCAGTEKMAEARANAKAEEKPKERDFDHNHKGSKNQPRSSWPMPTPTRRRSPGPPTRRRVSSGRRRRRRPSSAPPSGSSRPCTHADTKGANFEHTHSKTQRSTTLASLRERGTDRVTERILSDAAAAAAAAASASSARTHSIQSAPASNSLLPLLRSNPRSAASRDRANDKATAAAAAAHMCARTHARHSPWAGRAGKPLRREWAAATIFSAARDDEREVWL